MKGRGWTGASDKICCMAATPQITLRVQKDTLERWKRATDSRGTNVATQLRTLMMRWVKEVEEEDGLETYKMKFD